MFLKQKTTGDLIEITDVAALVNPGCRTVEGRSHVGEELQDPQSYDKEDLKFPSGEPLPKCWMNADYKTAVA